MKKTDVTLILTLLVVPVTALLAWALWQLVAVYVSPPAARAWALLATVAIPAAAWTGYRIGLTEARGKLRGIDAGIDRVTRAAATAIDLRTQHRAATHPTSHIPHPTSRYPALPDPVITIHHPDDASIIDL